MCYPHSAVPEWFKGLIKVIGICILLCLFGWMMESDQQAAYAEQCYRNDLTGYTRKEFLTCIKQLEEEANGSTKEYHSK